MAFQLSSVKLCPPRILGPLVSIMIPISSARPLCSPFLSVPPSFFFFFDDETRENFALDKIRCTARTLVRDFLLRDNELAW